MDSPVTWSRSRSTAASDCPMDEVELFTGSNESRVEEEFFYSTG
jgi:hypothetical protein